MKFYISDLHFGHKNVINLDNRPFKDIEEMEERLIENWNNAVSNKDEVYILGDIFWKKKDAERILPMLNGIKFLVLGNHDNSLNTELLKHFVWVKEIAYITDENKEIVLCHYPLAHWKNQTHGYIHLYGHIHEGRDSRPFENYKEMCKRAGIAFEAYNVGCMKSYMNYTPQTLENILKFAH